MKKELLTLSFVVLIAAPAATAILKLEKTQRWWASRNINSDEFARRFEQFSNDNHIMIDFDAHSTSEGMRYSAVWEENTDKRQWAVYRDLTADEYNRRWDECRNRGLRPHDLESWLENGQQKFAGIWVESKDGAWESRRGETSEEFNATFDNLRGRNFRPIHLQPYATIEKVVYASIWLENKEKIEWHLMRDMSREVYEAEVAKRNTEGYCLVDFEAYTIAAAPRFSAIWEKRPGFVTQARSDRTGTDFDALFNQFRDQSMRPIDFEYYSTPNGIRAAGVWIGAKPEVSTIGS